MDGRGRWMDNVFIERLWRSLKSEDVYLKGYADGRKAARGIAEWVAFYVVAGIDLTVSVWRQVGCACQI
jgi:transposase InsO family protein